MITTPHRVEGERGALAPALLLVMVAVAAGMLLFLQVGHATVLATEADTAADAAALGGAENLRDQIFAGGSPGDLAWNAGGVLRFGVDQNEVCAAARTYAERNGAGLETCEVDTRLGHLSVQVSVRGHHGTIEGPLSDSPDKRPVKTAKAEIDLPAAAVGGGGGGNRDLSRDALAPEYRDHTAEELMEVLIEWADTIHRMRLTYVFGGGHTTPAPRYGPHYDCSSSVSALIQTIYPDFPTLTSASFASVGAPGPSPTGGLTIWSYTGNPGHVFVVLGGEGWGTGDNGWSTGPGWLRYNTPYGAHPWIATHIPLLEGADSAVVNAALANTMAFGSGSGWGSVGGPLTFGADIRLVSVD